MGATRRGFIYGAGSVIGGLLVYNNQDKIVNAATDNNGSINVPGLKNKSLLDNKSSSNWRQTNFGLGSGPFKKGKWTDEGKLIITIDADHEFDELGVWHEYDDRENSALWGTFGIGNSLTVPKYDGEMTIPILKRINNGGNYPTRKFKLIGFKSFAETTATATFVVPDQFDSPNLPD